MVIISDGNREYYEALGTLQQKMKELEKERVRLGLPENCTEERIENARKIERQCKVLIAEEDMEYYADLGMLQQRMKELELERVRLDLPKYCTEEDIRKAKDVEAKKKIEYFLEQKERKAEVIAVRRALQIPDSVSDQQIDNALNIRMERLTIQGPLSHDEARKKYDEEVNLYGRRAKK